MRYSFLLLGLIILCSFVSAQAILMPPVKLITDRNYTILIDRQTDITFGNVTSDYIRLDNIHSTIGGIVSITINGTNIYEGENKQIKITDIICYKWDSFNKVIYCLANKLYPANQEWVKKYNPYTITGRPSNAWRGVNYAALNKTDGSRKSFISSCYIFI